VLAVLFRQGVKGADLRERTLDFITNQVVASKETLFRDPDIEMFFLEEMQKVRTRSQSFCVLTRHHNVVSLTSMPSNPSGYRLRVEQRARDIRQNHHANKVVPDRKAGLDGITRGVHCTYHIREAIQCKCRTFLPE